MHIDTDILDSYLSRSLSREQLRTIDEHVNTCVPCRLAVETEGLEPERWERRGLLGRLGHAA